MRSWCGDATHRVEPHCAGTTATRELLCFTNKSRSATAARMLAGFRGALTRQVNGYAEPCEKGKDRLTATIARGLTRCFR